MKKKSILVSCIISFIISVNSVTLKAQLTLGDIAFTGYNGGPVAGSDDFSFIILRSGGLPSGTTINFTNCGWSGAGACNTNGLMPTNGSSETDITWTSPGSVLAYGTQVRISQLTASVGTVSGLPLSLKGTGDQLFAFTGARTAPNFIAGMQMNVNAGATANGWDNLAAGSSFANASNRPPCLTNGTYSVWIDPESDNAVLNCSVLSALSPVKSTALTQIYNAANWDRIDGTVPYSLPRICSTLPVTLLSFEAVSKNGNIEFSWKVTEQQGLSHYELERSIDGLIFSTITTVQAQSGTGNITYQFTDKQSLRQPAPLLYFRLRSVDLDRKITYSKLVTIRNYNSGNILLTGLENALDPRTGFTVLAGEPGNLYLQLTDVQGRAVSKSSRWITQGNTTVILPGISGLPPGIYWLSLQLGSTIKKLSLIKK